MIPCSDLYNYLIPSTQFLRAQISTIKFSDQGLGEIVWSHISMKNPWFHTDILNGLLIRIDYNRPCKKRLQI